MHEVENIKPYSKRGDKTSQVRQMFDNIAPAYDFMNRAMTFGIDKLWRRTAIKKIASLHPASILDIATGTGDLAIGLARKLPEAKITGVDVSAGMLEIAQCKIEKAALTTRVELRVADGTKLPFPNDSFDCITIAFGIRNFQDILKGYNEFHRVLKPGGTLVVIELSIPANPVVKSIYKVYTRTLVPLAGRLISHDSRAYSYLPESIAAVPQREDMLELLLRSQFVDVSFRSLFPGTCIIYTAKKQFK